MYKVSQENFSIFKTIIIFVVIVNDCLKEQSLNEEDFHKAWSSDQPLQNYLVGFLKRQIPLCQPKALEINMSGKRSQEPLFCQNIQLSLMLFKVWEAVI